MEGETGVEGVSEHDVELAKSAKDAFDNHRYENCLSTLNRLFDARRHDARVAHNRAVAQYLLSNLTLTDEFRKNLQTVNAQFDRDAESAGGKVTINDKAVLLFNQALIHMRLHQNTHAAAILEQLYQLHTSLGTTLSIEVCLLLVEVYISTYQLDKATAGIEHLEARLFNSSQQPSSGRAGGEVEGELGASENGRYLSQLHLFKARIHLLHRSMKACKKELKNFSSSAGNTPCAQFLKSNMEYLRHNYRKCLKVLGSAPRSPIVTDAGECLSAFYFNNIGCVHFKLGKYSLAAHYFRKAIEENDAALNGFPPLDRATPLSGRPLAVLGMNCRHILLYNLGLQQLYAGHPLAAFDSLLEVVQVYHANPRIWLRLAEACIASQHKSELQQVQSRFRSSKTVNMVFGKGLHRKLVILPIQPSTKKGSGESVSQSAAMPAPTLEFAAICLRNALFLLPSTSALLGSSGITPITEGEEGRAEHPPAIPALPGPPIVCEDIIRLRCSVLCSLAYISLGLEDPVSALSYSSQLLDSPKLPGGLRFLGQLYASEALVHLGRVQESLQYLTPDSIGDVSVVGSPAGLQQVDQLEVHQTDQPITRPTSAGVMGVTRFPKSVSHARAVTMFNLASVFCLRREMDRAKKALQQAHSLFGDEVPHQVILLSAYIEISCGNTSVGLQIIKQHQAFPADRKKPRKATYLSARQ